jgi:uncharacterized protein
MNTIKKHLLLFVAITCLFSSCQLFYKVPSKSTSKSSKEKSVFPEAIGYVNDFENLLSVEEEELLTKIVKEHEAKYGDQIVIVTLTSIAPYENINDYSLALANAWGVGQKGKNNGVLIAFSKELRAIRIQNGFGIEKRLTDAETASIIDTHMIPAFKEDKYFLGLKNGVKAILLELR